MIRDIRLELARCRDFPEGSANHGYELRLPLTADGRPDRDAWLKHYWGVGFRRFWGEEEERGLLDHTRRGWALTFSDGQQKDEMIFKGDEHRFVEGEYVSIEERDAVTRTFRVVSVR